MTPAFNLYSQEFNALKRRCLGQDGNSLKCFCFVAVSEVNSNTSLSFCQALFNFACGCLSPFVISFIHSIYKQKQLVNRDPVFFFPLLEISMFMASPNKLLSLQHMRLILWIFINWIRIFQFWITYYKMLDKYSELHLFSIHILG